MARFRKTKGNRDWVARDSQMAVLAAILIVFVIAASLSDGKIIPDFSASTVKPETVTTAPDDELKTGSIYITPQNGDLCEHRLIDNATWRIRPNGYVDCAGPVSWAAQEATRNSLQRMEAIRDGFFPKRQSN